MAAANTSTQLQHSQLAVKLDFNSIPLKLDTESTYCIYNLNEIIGFDWGYRKARFKSHDVANIQAILNAIDGTRTLQDVAGQTGIDLAVITSVLQTFYELGALVLSETASVPALAFYRHTVARMRAKRYRMLQANPLFTAEMTGNQLLGFLIDSYHFIASAESHISPAIAQASTQEIQHVLENYLQEECWHGELIAKGLVSAGLDKHTLENSWPSFAIQGVINFTRHYARTDLEAYGLCAAVTEADTSGVLCSEDQMTIWDRLKALNLVPPSALEVFKIHDRLDYEAQHGDIPEIIFSNDQLLSYQRQQELSSIVSYYIDMIGDAYRHLNVYYRDHADQLWFNAA